MNCKIIITAPSLETKKNVSGISSVVKNIMKLENYDFIHFQVSREDGESRNIKWIIKQVSLIFNFFILSIKVKPSIYHFNTDFTLFSIIRDFFFITIASLFKGRILLHIHGGKYLTKNAGFVLNFLIKYNIKLCKNVIVLSEFEKSLVEYNYFCKNIYVLPNCIDFRNIKITKKENLHYKKIIFFGRIHESKGIDDIEKGLKLLNNSGTKFVFYVYGEGPRKEDFIAHLKINLGNKFQYRGVSNDDEKWNDLDNSDIFLLPSRYGEGMPMAMLEAMALGKVVVVSDDASIKTIIIDGYNGIIVKKFDPENIYMRLLEIIKNDSIMAEIGSNAKETIHLHFDWKVNREKLKEIYFKIIAEENK